jgi:hypothetical protein
MTDNSPQDDAARPETPGPATRPDAPSEGPRIPTAREAAGALIAAAPMVQRAWLLIAATAAFAIGTLFVGPLAVAPPAIARLQGAAATIGVLVFFGLAAWLSGPLLRACAAGLVLFERRAEVLESIDRRVAQVLDRAAGPFDRPPATSAAAGAPAATDHRAEVREAIRGADWARAEALIREFRDAHPDDPEADRLAQERDHARADAAGALRPALDAARKVNDPDRALELRDALVPLVDAGALHALDQDLVRWLMGLIQKRLRTGTVRVDVAELAARVSERFAHTMEGASLRASLPTLRRSAGLCARCGQPYQGIADACPACLSTASFPAFGHADVPDSDPDEDEIAEDD